MSEKSGKNMPFVVNDRRKFTLDGEPRPDADPSPEREPRPEAVPAPVHEAPLEFKSPASVEDQTPPAAETAELDFETEPGSDPGMPPPPTAEEMQQAGAAFQQTVDRLDTAVRAQNPGGERPPIVDFQQILQSIYMTAIMQLGGNTPHGQQPQVDLMGARQSIDMLGILAAKTKGNLTPAETTLMDTALFELRMGFLEVTQALARSAASRSQTGQPAPKSGPSIVR